MDKHKHTRDNTLLLLLFKTFTITVRRDTRLFQLPIAAEQGPSVSRTALQTPAAQGTGVTQPCKCIAVTVQGQC